MTKKILFLSILISFLTISILPAQTAKVVPTPVANFHYLYLAIKKGEIAPDIAQDSTRKLLADIKAYYIENGGKPCPDSFWYFPVQGYGMNMIGGKNGSDYIPGKYNFYNTYGNSSHPAHDIFINDKDQNSIDDNSNQPVQILAMTGGIVVSTEHFWDTTMTAKGGNYIYIYEPFSKMLYYYAHNDILWVALGDIVTPGQHIANMGRTGLNAYKKRSPTHLHFSMLQFYDDGRAEPVRPYFYLEKAKRKK